MKIALEKARELSSKELDQVAGGGSIYLGNGNSHIARPTPPLPHQPVHP
jgi:hypothetical protein